MGFARNLVLLLLGLALALESRALFDDEASLREQLAEIDAGDGGVTEDTGQVVLFLHELVGHDGAQGLELVIGIGGLALVARGVVGIVLGARRPPPAPELNVYVTPVPAQRPSSMVRPRGQRRRLAIQAQRMWTRRN